MPSKVYFVKVSEGEAVEAVKAKLASLLDTSRVLSVVKKGDSAAVKIHFGEEGNVGHVLPEYAGLVCRKLTDSGAKPFLTDTNTLYKGRRTNSADHVKLAAEHGFTKETCGCPIVVPDDTKQENVRDKIASIFLDADSIVGIAHFKGHIMTGFGGALKNIGMGCASREGKLAQHSDIAPVVLVKNCTGCMACIKSCPTSAIRLENKVAVVDGSKCIGCATCIAVCVHGAIQVDWESGGSNIQEKMIEYASAVLSKNKKQAFITFATKITQECDCLAKDDPRIMPDVGIFASNDPVAIDKAAYDTCNKMAGKDIFRAAHPDRDGAEQLKHASRLGMGSLDYELIEL